jgi:redox-sensitive bicupin YhaK (pirin superfamily)
VSLGQFVAGSEVDYKVREPSHGVYVMVTSGSVTIGDTVLEARDAIGITEATEVGVRVDTDASLLVLEVPMTGA